MSKLNYVKYDKICLVSLRNSMRNGFRIIAEDPSILGLGDLILKDKERL